MSDFPGESTELDRDERCPSSFLDPDLLPSEYESVIEDMSYPEVSWNAQDRYYMHPTLEQPVVCESDNERNEQGTLPYSELGRKIDEIALSEREQSY